MPESWLRYLFLQLAEACIVMERGTIEDSSADDWPEEIVQWVVEQNVSISLCTDLFASRDIKPGS